MQERELFLSILSDYIHGRTTCLGADVDWNVIFDISKKHQLTGIIIDQCGEMDVDEATQKMLANYFVNLLATRAKQEKNIAKIAAYLQENAIPYCVVKGSSVAKYYHQNYHRAMGDIDIVVKSEDREKVHRYMLSEGYDNKSKNINYEWVYTKGAVSVEVHDRLLYPEVFNKKCEEDFFNNIWCHVDGNEIEPNFHFLYLIYHLKKHLTSNGAGFRQFVDLAMLWKHCDALDKEAILDGLEKTEMTEFAKVIFALCAVWFEDEALNFFENGWKPEPEVLEAQTEAILQNGLFGQFNAKNKINISVNNFRSSRFKWVTKLCIILRQLFPCYHDMIATKNYAFLEHKPYLLLFAWIYRFFINVKKKKVKSFFDHKLKFASSEEQKQREKDLEQWRIL